MKKEELAKQITGREYGNEITDAEEQIAKESGLIVIFGQSDDLVEFRGVINDEIDAYDGTTFIIATPGMMIPCDPDDEDVYRKINKLEPIAVEEHQPEAKNVFEAVWSPDEPQTSWLIKSVKTPFAEIDIMEDGELYCRGIVIDVTELEEQPQ